MYVPKNRRKPGLQHIRNFKYIVERSRVIQEPDRSLIFIVEPIHHLVT